jgi:hypothetical protein
MRQKRFGLQRRRARKVRKQRRIPMHHSVLRKPSQNGRESSLKIASE